jgi:hypothetical protein
MRHDADISVALEGCRACHEKSSDGAPAGRAQKGNPEPNVVGATYQR